MTARFLLLISLLFISFQSTYAQDETTTDTTMIEEVSTDTTMAEENSDDTETSEKIVKL